jgi:hypothetical protein
LQGNFTETDVSNCQEVLENPGFLLKNPWKPWNFKFISGKLRDWAGCRIIPKLFNTILFKKRKIEQKFLALGQKKYVGFLFLLVKT